MKDFKSVMSKLWLLTAVLLLTACGVDNDSGSEPLKPNNGDNSTTVDPNVPTLSDVKYELRPTAVLVPESTAKQITNVDLASHKLTLPKTATKPEVGQCLIINTVTSQLPDGLLAKVKSVNDGATGYEVSYQDAELGDAFKTLEIKEQYIPLGDYVQRVVDANGNEIDFKKSREWSAEWGEESFTRVSGSPSFTIKIPEVAWPLGTDKLKLTPKMTVDMNMRFVLMYGDYKVDYLNAKVDAKVNVGADLNFQLGEAKLVNKRWPLVTVFCAGIPVGPIVITPGIEIAAVFKIDGTVSLEASVSYTRKVHSNILYQQGHLEASTSIDPPAADALQFSFGPKFEGGISYGLSVGPFFGIYGKAMAVTTALDVVKKETISGKVNILELVNNKMIAIATMPATELNAVLKGDGIDITGWEGFMLNQSLAMTASATLHVLAKDMGSIELPEVSYPIDSRLIMPDIVIDTKDFLKVSGEEATLKLHMTKKSLLAKESKFYAVWTNTNDATDVHKLTFDLDDSKLKALEKDNEISFEAKCKLKKAQSYKLKVYMELWSKQITVYEGGLEVEGTASVSPTSLNFGWDDYSVKTVKVDKGGYSYYNVDTPPEYTDWIIAVSNGDGTVSVSTLNNLTFEQRQGEIKCWVANKADARDSEKKYMTVTVTQDPVSGVDWTPKELTYTAAGGSQDISFSFGTFTRFGATVGNEGKGWCSVSAANGKVTITVKPLTASEDRECIVNCYVSNYSSPKDDQKVLMPVKVVQKAQGDEGAFVDPVYFNIPREGAVTFAKYGFGDFNHVRRVFGADWLRGGWSADYESTNRFKREFYIAIPPNTTGVARRDTIKFLFGAESDTPNEQRYCIPVVVRQEGGSFKNSDLKSLVVGKWHHHIISSSAWQVEYNYDLVINADGTYTEHQKEDNINGQSWHTDVTESGSYTITGYEVPTSSSLCIQVKVSLSYQRGPTNGTKTSGTRQTTWEVYPHFMRYIEGRSMYYDRQ